MGMFDTYKDGDSEAQLKNGNNLLTEYRVGDSVVIPDGIYDDGDVYVVIKDSKLVGVFNGFSDKFGHPLIVVEVRNQ